MSRLIDADEIRKKAVPHTRGEFGGYNSNIRKWAVLVGDIDDAPTVDAVEVVRCKDCKHFVHGEPYDPCECMKWKVKFGVAYTTPDGYCHKGESKDNDL